MGDTVIVDFTNVKESSGFNPTHQQAGDYRGIIKSVDRTPAKGGNPMITYAIADADRPSAVYRYNCVLTENSLWKLRNLIVAAGLSAPKKRFKFDPDKLLGKAIGMSLDDDEYEGKMRSQIVGVFPESDLPDEEDEPAAAKKKAKKKAEMDDDDEDTVTDDEEEDLEELDVDDL